ncbi:daptomycin-sensing surface protein LiaX [Enterococcus sp. LJL90]
MKERERILELVKKGILSTEEGLDLLESMATAKDEKQIEKAADAISPQEKAAEFKVEEDFGQSLEEELEEIDAEAAQAEKAQEDRENLEKILAELADEANQTSAELDEVNVEIAGLKIELKDTQEALMELNTKEDLDALTEVDLATRESLEATIKGLEVQLETLEIQKNQLNESLKNIRKDQWSTNKDSFSGKVNEKIQSLKNEIPDDFKEQATETFTQVGKNMSEAGSQIGRLFKKTFKAVSESVNDNFEWKDLNVKVPGVATTKFEHTFEYEANDATLIDVKVANGNIEFKTWAENYVKVEGKFRLYGKMDAETPLQALMERSQIEVDDDHISFQIPNKRVRADLTFYLPSRTYDHVQLRLLNGNVLVSDLDVKDIYLKSTNGNITTDELKATMLEIEGVNGNITIGAGEILDLIVETVNGTASINGAAANIGVSLVNGDVKVTAKHDNLNKIDASAVNGNVKIALPEAVGFEGLAKTSLGSINTRLSDYDVVREKKEKLNQLLQFRRVADQVAKINLSTTTGNIFLKDAE